MKAFTDINQSRKLAGILPLESADMWWREVSYGFYHIEAEIPNGWYDVPPKGIPCWSLATLLGQMICPKLENYVQNSWDLEAAMDDTLQRWLSVQDCPTAVDACYEMIIKMHEQKLL